jgi:ubiquinone/menaquinone biosynthesis C-methylase UbiE
VCFDVPVTDRYVHGYHERENDRLRDQAGTLVELLHHDTAYSAGSAVLEAGCGVGAQTITLASRSPGAHFTSIDVSADSLAEAGRRVTSAGLTNVESQRADIFSLPFPPGSFDHVFVCFVLEHLARPADALRLLGALLRPGGTVTVIEGDHGSAYFHPDDPAAELVRSIANPAGGLLVDIWHIFRSGTAYAELVEKLPAEYVFAVEMSDGRAQPVGTLYDDTFDNRLAPGEGDFDVVGFIRAIDRLGFPGPWGLEVMSAELRSLPIEVATKTVFDAVARVFELARA